MIIKNGKEISKIFKNNIEISEVRKKHNDVFNVVYSGIELPSVQFISDTPFTINNEFNGKRWNGEIQYSTDNSEWFVWDGTSIGGSNTLYLRGVGNTQITGGVDDGYGRFIFTGASNLRAFGCLDALLDCYKYSKGEKAVMSDYAFTTMFHGSPLTNTLEFSSADMTVGCYKQLYSSTRITESSPLPDVPYAESCFESLFSRSNISKLPTINSTYPLVESCFSYMFEGCNNLSGSANLPHTTLSPYCYYSMFSDSNIGSCENLPAEDIPPFAYGAMFFNCSNMKVQATWQPVTVGDYGCYQMYMRSGVINVDNLPATTVGRYGYGSMFAYCMSLRNPGKFIESSLKTQDATEGMFQGSSLKVSTFGTSDIRTQWYIPRQPITYLGNNIIAGTLGPYKSSIRSNYYYLTQARG